MPSRITIMSPSAAASTADWMSAKDVSGKGESSTVQTGLRAEGAAGNTDRARNQGARHRALMTRCSWERRRSRAAGHGAGGSNAVAAGEHAAYHASALPLEELASRAPGPLGRRQLAPTSS